MDSYLSESGDDVEEKHCKPSMLFEQDLPVRSKQAFQLDITDQLNRIEKEAFPSQTRIADGHGILSAKIRSATFGTTHPDGRCMVKASYVEPGETDNVLFRSKQMVFTTEEVGQRGGVYSWNAQFEYDIHPPLVPHMQDDSRRMSDWNALTGDILFAVYDTRGGRSNVFLGQTLLPLRGLIQGIGASVHGGDQEEMNQDFILRARDGSTISHASIHLELQLRLPPEEPITPKATPSRLRKSLARRTRELKGASKCGSGAKDRHVEHLRYSRRRRARARTLRQAQISRENDQLNRRVRGVEATLNLPKGVHGRARYSTTKAGPPRDGPAIRSEVLESITSARVRLNEINEKRNRAKQEIVRSERLIKKLRQDVESIKVETSVLPATLKTRRNNRSPRKKDASATEVTSQTDDELIDLRKRVLKVLRSYGDIDSRSKLLKAEAHKMEIQRTRIKAEIEEVQSKIIKAKRRRQALANQILRSGQDSVEVQLLEDIRALKVQAKLKEEEKLDLQEKHKRNLSRLDEDISNMSAKLQRKKAKIEGEKEKAEKLASKSCELKEKIAVLVTKLTVAKERCLD